jgi:hypothetical protein
MGISIMELTLYKKTEAVNTNEIAWDVDGNPTEYGEPFPVLLWKFKDENGNLWNTETGINGTEEEAATIILNSINNGN